MVSRTLVTGLLVISLVSNCTPNLPAGMQAAISSAVVAHVVGSGSMFYSAGVDSFEVKDATIGANHAWVHAWIGVWFKNRVSGPSFTAHNVDDDDFTQREQGGRWVVTSIHHNGFAPGGGP